MNYLEALNKRYSVKKFDPEKNVSTEALHNILEAARLSASSLGLQPYRIIIIQNSEMKEKLIPAFYNPSQISTCSHLIVIVSKNSIGSEYISNYFSHISETREVPLESLNPFKESINKHIQHLNSEEVMIWADKQSYIVLGNLMFAAALENVDTCPMEGFKQKTIDEILGLDSEKERVAVTLALGYRSEEDAFQKLKKVRKPNDKLFKFI
ncbi:MULTISPECIES: NAD(P)H-dependent oxidoreductase [unclassified Kaistella]|uniref:NAD(P)H-dependent oxidoreductase n=1 Tax=unclassified Kaistella TaxID=2762626 RepID=UPI0027352E02|nr:MULTISPECIES: NAD(P)H-dependent oxidoreductase [unclassified Kaistella]MDP2454966.1 NAD(P)H-dependent oxidoreductase [Kaistella sp. SH11-4b]MDP2456051.1 NAD(P)H-dependent oxidoreductase [Kaistella sp. SH40-3]MDP2460636.1 NAD(P)H-dependent oxidoreductase [Kaistella sp. SH19-2b]